MVKGYSTARVGVGSVVPYNGRSTKFSTGGNASGCTLCLAIGTANLSAKRLKPTDHARSPKPTDYAMQLELLQHRAALVKAKFCLLTLFDTSHACLIFATINGKQWPSQWARH